VQILGQKGRLSPRKNLPSLVKRRGTPVVTAPPLALNLNRDRPQASKILRFWHSPALIRINGCGVAEKHQSTGNFDCWCSDIALLAFLFYPDLAPV